MLLIMMRDFIITFTVKSKRKQKEEEKKTRKVNKYVSVSVRAINVNINGKNYIFFLPANEKKLYLTKYSFSSILFSMNVNQFISIDDSSIQVK